MKRKEIIAITVLCALASLCIIQNLTSHESIITGRDFSADDYDALPTRRDDAVGSSNNRTVVGSTNIIVGRNLAQQTSNSSSTRSSLVMTDAPIAPTLPAHAFDMYIRQHNCPLYIDHLHKSRERWKRKRNNQSDWTQLTIDDKWGFYVFVKSLGFNVPKIMFCTALGPSKLYDFVPPDDGSGFVIKPQWGGLSKGVFVLQSGFDAREELSGKRMSRDNVVEKLRSFSDQYPRQNFGYLHVEEVMVGKQGGQKGPPTDYKVFVADGSVISVSIIFNRGSENHCVGIVDGDFNRMDEHGCFARRTNRTWNVKLGPEDGNCRVPTRGFHHPSQKRCSAFAKPAEWDEMLQVARRFSSAIGIWARIDLYWHDGKPFLGEVEFVPTEAKFHCQSRLDDDGCVDPCVHGRVWHENNAKYGSVEGGPRKAEPEVMKGWQQLSIQEKCERVMQA